jgi:hypothetical protein
MKEITLFLNLLLSGAPKKHIAKAMREHGFVVVTFGHEEIINGTVHGVTEEGIPYEEVPSITRDVVSVPGTCNYAAEINTEVVDVLLWAYYNGIISYWAGDQWEDIQA